MNKILLVFLCLWLCAPLWADPQAYLTNANVTVLAVAANKLNPTDVTPTSIEGQLWAADTAGRLKYYTGVTWTSILQSSDVNSSLTFTGSTLGINLSNTNTWTLPQNVEVSLLDNLTPAVTIRNTNASTGLSALNVYTAKEDGYALEIRDSTGVLPRFFFKSNGDAQLGVNGGTLTFGGGNEITVDMASQSVHFKTKNMELVPTNTTPTAVAGTFFSHLAETRPKYYTGADWKKFLLAGDAAGTADANTFTAFQTISASRATDTMFSVYNSAADGRAALFYVGHESATDPVASFQNYNLTRGHILYPNGGALFGLGGAGTITMRGIVDLATDNTPLYARSIYNPTGDYDLYLNYGVNQAGSSIQFYSGASNTLSAQVSGAGLFEVAGNLKIGAVNGTVPGRMLYVGGAAEVTGDMQVASLDVSNTADFNGAVTFSAGGDLGAGVVANGLTVSNASGGYVYMTDSDGAADAKVMAIRNVITNGVRRVSIIKLSDTYAFQAAPFTMEESGILTLTGPVRVGTGSVSFPAYAFSSSNDTDTGMYRAAENNIGFSAGAAQVLNLGPAGATVTGAAVVSSNVTASVVYSTAGGITVSLTKAPMGEIYQTTNTVATDITATGTFVLAAGDTTFNSDSVDFDQPQANRLRYTGAKPKMFHVACTVSYHAAAGTNQQLQVHLRKNGSVLPGSLIMDTNGTSSDVESSAIHVATMMNQNDYLEVWTTDNSAANDVVFDTMNLFAMGMSAGQD